MPDLSDTIEQVAAEPASASVDGQTAAGQPLPHLIEADKYLAAKEAVTGTNANGGGRSGWNLLRPARAVPPSALGGP